MAATGTVSAAQSGDYTYSLSTSDPQVATITGYIGAGDAVTIPATIDGYQVVAIGDNAFQNNDNISSVTFGAPSAIASFGNYSFDHCSVLTSFTMPDSVVNIWDYAFDEDHALVSCVLSPTSGLKTIGYAAFYWCDALASFTFPEGLTDIGDYAFHVCQALTSVSIPASVTTIGNSPFSNCIHVLSYTVASSNPNYLSQGGVLYDKAIHRLIQYPLAVAEDFIIPSTVKTICESAFSQATLMTSVTIPTSVTTIENYAFVNCVGLTTLVIPDSVTSIGMYGFNSCTHLTSLKISSGITIINMETFENCNSLKTINIPHGVLSIQFEAFFSCTQLTKLTIPEGVTYIAAKAFMGATSMTNVTIPSTVTTFGDQSFSGCTLLTKMVFNGSAPTNTNWIDNYNPALTIYYYYGAAGFTTPFWGIHNIPTVCLSGLTMATNFGTTTPGIGTRWATGSVVISATAPTAGYGERYLWNGWTGTGVGSYTGTDNSVTITVSGPITQTASWTHQYLVSYLVTPWGAGTTAPSGSGIWVNAGPLAIAATPIGSYTFAGWTSDTTGITFVNAALTSTSATITGPGNITAHFNTFAPSVTITSSPSGDGYVMVDGVAIKTPHTFNTWLAGSNHTIAAISALTISWGEQYAFNAWTDLGAQTHVYRALLASDTVTANYDHQYLLTIDTVLGANSPINGDSWHNAGSTVGISSVAPSIADGERYWFKNWTGTGSGSYSGPINAHDVTMNGPVNETAYWMLQCRLVMATNFGATTPTAGEHWYNATTPVEITALAPTANAGEQYVFNGWTHTGTGGYSGSSNPMTVTMNAAINQTASWTRQFALTMATNTGTTVPGSGDHWYNAGTSVQISAVAASLPDGERYMFNHWTGTGIGGYSGSDNFVSVTMNAPITETAAWTLQYQLIVAANFGTTSPGNGEHWYNETTSVIISVTAPTTDGVNYIFNNWTGTGLGSYNGTDNSVTITMDGPINQTASWALQYRLIMSTNFGTTSPSVGVYWFNPLTVKDISATPPSVAGNLYIFAGWAGKGVGSYTGSDRSMTVTMNGPINETATWIAPDTLSLRITSPTNGSFDRTGTVTVTWVVSDLTSTVTSVEINTGGTIWTAVTGDNYTMTLMHDGTHVLYVRATDLAGHVNNTAVSFIVDTIAPSLAFVTPANGTRLNSTSVGVRWTVSDTGSGVATTQISINGMLYTTVLGTNTTLTLTEGTQTIYLKATDKAGNSRTVTTTFTIDTTAPTISTKSPTGLVESTRSKVRVTFSEEMDHNATTITVNGITGTVTWNGVEAVFTPATTLKGRTTYTVNVNGKDLAGNSLAATTWTFKTAKVGTITGIIRGHNGNVLGGVIVKLLGHNTAASTGMSYFALDLGVYDGIAQETTTDANGSYSFYDVAIGNYTLEFTEDGYATQDIPVSMTSDAVDLGGVTMDSTVATNSSDNTMLYAVAIIAVIVVVLLLVLVVRRKKGPSKTEASARGTEIAAKDAGKEKD